MSEIPFSIRSRRGGGTASDVNDLGGMNFSTLDDNEIMKRVDANNVGGSGLVAIEVPAGVGTVSSHIMITNEGGNVLSSFLSQTDSVTNEYILQMKPHAGNSSTTALTIKDDGSAETKVGINIADPEEVLDIEGNLQLRSGSQGKIFFKHPSGLQKVELDGNQDGTNGGKFMVKTKVDGGSMTQKLEINNDGAIGLGATPTYGTAGQVLTSNGSGSGATWTNQTDTTYSAGTGVNLAGTTFSIGQEVGPSNDPSFNTLTLNGAVSGTQLLLNRVGGFANLNLTNSINNHSWRLAGPGAVTTTGIFTDTDGLVLSYYNGTAGYNRVHFMSNGNQSITGTFYSNRVINVSDDRLKFNEEPINNGLNTILQLQPTKYDKSLTLNVEEDTEREAGFIAQEVFEIPELKPYVVEGTAEDSWKINYTCIIPYLVGAVKEQNAIISSLRVRIEALETAASAN
jgi:hypothetical protein